MGIKGLITTVGVAALLAAPVTATAAKPDPATHGQGKAKAYGKYCQGESKEHVTGEKGTAFSRCVQAMAKADPKAKEAGEVASPKEACKGLSKKHAKGEKGTAFSRCVVAAAQLQKDKEEQDSEPAGS